MKYIYAFIIFFSFTSSFAKPANQFRFPQGEVALLSSGNTLLLHFKIIRNWHIYWKNSGDSGAPPTWKWDGVNVRKANWPVPQRLPVAGLINFGYSFESLFTFEIDPPVQPTSAKLNLEFLICKIECIPYIVQLEKEVSHEVSAKAEVLMERFVYPTPAPENFEWTLDSQDLESENKSLTTTLSIPDELAKNLRSIELFPEDGENFKATAPMVDPISDGEYKVTVLLDGNSAGQFENPKFLLVVEDKKNNVVAHEIVLKKPKVRLALILLWALIGGFILNFMPCVFPVLSIKILSFLGHDKNSNQLRLSGWFYTTGVVLSFLVIGGILLLLRAGGEQIGWGFQLQSPVVASAIALLFFWLGFNFLGAFEIGQSFASVGPKKSQSTNWGAFLTGVLATVVATPCTAPFMGAALGASLTLPSQQTMLVFSGLGLGMAFPFLLLAYFPQALQFLPKPGMWMQKLKEFLAFPLFLTVIWLLWVLSQQIETNGLIFILTVMVLAGFWIWFTKYFKDEKRRQWLLVAGFLFSMGLLHFLPTEPASKKAASTILSKWKPYSKTEIMDDVAAKRSVFIDFTAAWCITCQVNKKLVLHTDDIMAAFDTNNVVLYQADWTDRSPEITAALQSFGRNSLPLYVFYDAATGKPEILPEVLTKTMILNLFNKKIEQEKAK